jgi:hypothetical protein
VDHAKARELFVVVGVGAAFCVALFLELPGLNGTWYWQWPWRSLDVIDTLAVFAAPLLVLGLVAWLWSRAQPSAADARVLVCGLVVCEILLQWARVRAEPGGWAWLQAIVQSRDATSYYTDAARIDDVGAFLRDFSWKRLEHHSSTHPPGPVLYYWVLVRLFGPEPAALIGGALIGVLASAGVAVAYVFAGLWTIDPARRLGGCFMYALMPALVAVLPSFDQVYPILTMFALLAWRRAFERTSAAVGLGLLAFLMTMLAYQFLLLAIPFAIYAFAELRERSWDPKLRIAIVRATAIAFGVWLGLNVFVAVVTPFNPFESFVAALGRQARYQAFMQRPYGTSLIYDPYDFFLGGGVMLIPLLVIHFARESRPRVVLTTAGLLSIAIVDVSGLIRCEAARVWLFLQPLVVVPAGLTLATFKPTGRALVLATASLTVVAIVCKLIFLRLL